MIITAPRYLLLHLHDLSKCYSYSAHLLSAYVRGLGLDLLRDVNILQPSQNLCHYKHSYFFEGALVCDFALAAAPYHVE